MYNGAVWILVLVWGSILVVAFVLRGLGHARAQREARKLVKVLDRRQA